MKRKISITINDRILKEVDSIVDNVYIQNRSQAIESLIQRTLEKRRPAVILAGEGRVNMTKKLKDRYALKVGPMTLIEHAIRKLKDSGFTHIYIVASHGILTKIFKIVGDGSDYGVSIEFVDEENESGSASALKLLHDKIKTTFLVVQSDIFFDAVDIEELWKQHVCGSDTITLRVCSSVIPGGDTRYGRVKLQGNKILSYVERPVSKSDLGSSIFFGGIFVTDPEIFGCQGSSLEHDIFPELAKKKILGGWMSATDHYHIHTHEDLLYVRKAVKKKI